MLDVAGVGEKLLAERSWQTAIASLAPTVDLATQEEEDVEVVEDSVVTRIITCNNKHKGSVTLGSSSSSSLVNLGQRLNSSSSGILAPCAAFLPKGLVARAQIATFRMAAGKGEAYLGMILVVALAEALDLAAHHKCWRGFLRGPVLVVLLGAQMTCRGRMIWRE